MISVHILLIMILFLFLFLYSVFYIFMMKKMDFPVRDNKGGGGGGAYGDCFDRRAILRGPVGGGEGEGEGDGGEQGMSKTFENLLGR